MIPNNAFTTTPIVSAFLPPKDEPYQPLSSKSRGGIALNDASLGRDYQNWVVSYDGANILVAPQDGATAFSLPVAGVLSVSLAFDNNMNVILAWMDSVGAKLYWFDNENYVTSDFAAISCRVTIDDVRPWYNASSDVIFTYTNANKLYWRQQRDQYAIEYTVGSTTGLLRKVGLNQLSRLQFELTAPITIAPAAGMMTLTFDTAIANTVYLPLGGFIGVGVSVNAIIDWGDGNTESAKDRKSVV